MLDDVPPHCGECKATEDHEPHCSRYWPLRCLSCDGEGIGGYWRVEDCARCGGSGLEPEDAP